jgi:nitrogenase iron protein NifH
MVVLLIPESSYDHSVTLNCNNITGNGPIRRVALYGKGGIGKSTVASNVSAALAEKGHRVMQIGCDPKADSTRLLRGGSKGPSVLDSVREGRTGLDGIVSEGYAGVLCVECGGPRPGTGCAGRGIIVAFETLERRCAVETFRPDVIIYDVLGDVVCGGFAMPIRDGYARDVFIVTSGETMSLYAAADISEAVHCLREDGCDARLSGLIQNSRDVQGEDELVSRAAGSMGTEIVSRIPRSRTVQECEAAGKTVIEGAPDSPQAVAYRALAAKILAATEASEGGLRQNYTQEDYS